MSGTSSSTPLERGKACLRCRRRKMRCDGARPACGQCLRSDRGADCEYADGQGPTTNQLLEQQVTHLEGRIAELESATSVPLTLQDPYEVFHRSSGAAQAAQTGGQRSQSHHDLMRAFFQHAYDVGFFLHVQRFLSTVSAIPPGGYPHHVSLLLNVIYVLGAQFSNDIQVQAQQAGYLSRALEQLSSALSSGNSSAIIYVLQAEILLAYYFLDNNRSLEGVYHIKAAVSIVLACKLHQIRSSRPSTAATGGIQYRLSPPADHVEEGERINAFWTVYILDKSCLGSSPALTEDESKGTQIDVPWPLDMEEYETRPLPSGLRSWRTVQTFLQNQGAEGPEVSLLALHAKAASLFAAANDLSARWDPGNPTFQGNFAHLRGRIERFKQSLPSISRLDPARYDLARNLLVIHTLVNCASLNLHKPSEPQAVSPTGVSWTTATTSAAILQRIDTNVIVYVNPIMGTLLTTIADVLVRGIMTAQSQNAINASNRASLMAPVNRILFAMGQWGILSPFIRHQLAVIQQTLPAI